MLVIGQETFVIEMQEAVEAKNKTVVDDNDGLITVPDGEIKYQWMWFAGFGAHPTIQNMIGAVWSPYPHQAHRYLDRDEAIIINTKAIGPAGGGKVVPWSQCHKDEGKQIIIPVQHGHASKG